MRIEELINDCPSIQFIPCNPDKSTWIKAWQNTRAKHDFNRTEFVGLVCGDISGNIEVIDFDLKYDTSGNLFERYKQAVKAVDQEILKKLTVQETKSGGYHFIYKCSIIQGSQKLARRHPTPEELVKNTKATCSVLIETKGQDGYVVCAPSPGYKLVQGSFDKINTITPEERDLLLNTAREFNEYIEIFKPKITKEDKKIKGLTPWEDYDRRGDTMQLISNHGYKELHRRGKKTFVLRPGDSSSSQSGNYDHDLNLLSFFSTSTPFTPEKGYSPSAVFAILECKGDFSEASKRLYQMGYGDRQEKINHGKEPNESIKDPEKKETDFSNDIKTLSSLKERMRYEFVNGKPKGETTCFQSIDKHFTWMRGDVNVFAGHNNHGKSELALQLMLVKSVIHGWKWATFSPENLPEEYFYDCLIESYIGKSVDSTYPNCMTSEEYEKGMEFIGKHFILVDPEGASDVDSLLNIFQHLIDTYGVDGVMIDPWNSVDHDEGKREDQYLRKQLVKIKKFTKTNKTHFVIIAHPKSIGKHDNNEYKIPDQNDLSGGSMWGHKADNVIVIHRPNYGKDKKASEVDLISQKIKKQKQVGIPGTANLYFDRKSRRYLEMNGNCPLHTIEVKETPKSSYLSSFKFPEQSIDNWEDQRKY